MLKDTDAVVSVLNLAQLAEVRTFISFVSGGIVAGLYRALCILLSEYGALAGTGETLILIVVGQMIESHYRLG